MNRLISLLIYGTIITTKIRIKSVRNCAKQAPLTHLAKSVPGNAGTGSTLLFFFLFSESLGIKGRVAQRIRARGYEPRSRGFKSLLAQQKANCMVNQLFIFFI